MEKEKKIDATTRKKNTTLFMICIFSLLLAMSSGIEQFLTRLLFQIVLFGSQLMIVKTLLDDFYSN